MPSCARPASCSWATSRRNATCAAGEPLIDYLARRTGVAAAERGARPAHAPPRRRIRMQSTAYTEALDRFLALGGGDLDARARAVCVELSLAARLDRPVVELSGGEAGRAALACDPARPLRRASCSTSRRTISTSDGLERLERLLAGLPGGVVVISHDRAFLDATVNRIAAIAAGRPPLREWAGGWSDYAARARRGAPGRLRRVRTVAGAPARGLLAPGTPADRGTGRRREGRSSRHPRAHDEGAPGRAGARARGRPREAVRALGAPSRAARRAAARRHRRGAARRRRLPRRVPARPGRPRHRVAGAGRRHRPERLAASRPCSPRCSATCRWTPARASSAARP